MDNNRKVSRVEMSENGRYHCFGGADYNIHDLYAEEVGDERYSAEVEAEDDTGLNAFEERWLRTHGITHIIDAEAFHDEEVRPIDEWLKLSSTYTGE